jgi:hypothetical protein
MNRDISELGSVAERLDERVVSFSDLREIVDSIAWEPSDHIAVLVSEITKRIGRELTLLEHSLLLAGNYMGMCEWRVRG